MAEQSKLDDITIFRSLYEISHSSHFMEIQRREAEKATHWFVTSAGSIIDDGASIHDVVVRSDSRYITTRKLSGEARTLNKRTLVRAESLHLPQDMTQEGIKSFFLSNGRGVNAYRHIGIVALHEPGLPIFNPIKNEAIGYIDTNARGRKLASFGIERYLNEEEGMYTPEETKEQIGEDIQRIYEQLPKYLEEQVDAIKSIIEKRNGNR